MNEVNEVCLQNDGVSYIQLTVLVVNPKKLPGTKHVVGSQSYLLVVLLNREGNIIKRQDLRRNPPPSRCWYGRMKWNKIKPNEGAPCRPSGLVGNLAHLLVRKS